MKKKLFLNLLIFVFLLLNACSKEVEPVTTDPDESGPLTGVYILNAGKMGNNDATLDWYDPETKTLRTDIFALPENGRRLGDTGQSLLMYGYKIYIAVSGSSTIEVMSNSAILKHIEVKNENGAPRMPRYFAPHKDKVYVSLYDGYVACMDTLTMEIEKYLKVGDNPEQLVVANNKLYVANSGGMNFPNYGKTVSVVDLNTFTVTKTLEVGENPQYMAVDSRGNKVYLISTGDYSPGLNILQRIDVATDHVTKIEGFNASWMSMGVGDKLYVISTAYDENWNMTAKYFVYDTVNETITGDFITDGTIISDPYHISADKASGDVYIGSSDYINRGDMYRFSAAGRLIQKFGVSGINPEGAYFPEQ